MAKCWAQLPKLAETRTFIIVAQVGAQRQLFDVKPKCQREILFMLYYSRRSIFPIPPSFYFSPRRRMRMLDPKKLCHLSRWSTPLQTRHMFMYMSVKWISWWAQDKELSVWNVSDKWNPSSRSGNNIIAVSSPVDAYCLNRRTSSHK